MLVFLAPIAIHKQNTAFFKAITDGEIWISLNVFIWMWHSFVLVLMISKQVSGQWEPLTIWQLSALLVWNDKEFDQLKTRPSEANDASLSDFFILHLFHSPRPSFLPVPPSSSSLLPPRPSFFLVQHCLNHLESENGHFSSIWTKALPTDQWTNGRTNQRTDGRTRPLIEMRGRI